MFGESESESPRVPSPWDTLISTPPSPSPSSRHSPSPLSTATNIPKLVPEAEEGNVEYKLQLLSPSPARFARLVTQLKWRLLEGGGQAYYELGVADSGALVGLPRVELEQSLETLEMMAGEIGASVIVVKEIEVPAVMAGLAGSEADRWNGKRRSRRAAMGGMNSEGEGDSTTTTTTTEFETEFTTDVDDDGVAIYPKALPAPFHLRSSPAPYAAHAHTGDTSVTLFPMDSEPDPAENADAEADTETDLDNDVPHYSSQPQPQFSIDLEIASVFKPRPTRTRVINPHALITPGKRDRVPGPKFKKQRHLAHSASTTVATLPHPHSHPHTHDHADHLTNGDTERQLKPHGRRQARDRRREEKRKALMAYATNSQDADNVPPIEEAESTIPACRRNITTNTDADALVSGLESLHVPLDDPISVPISTSDPTLQLTSDTVIPTVHVEAAEDDEDAEDNDIDVFASPTPAPPFMTFPASSPSTAIKNPIDIQSVIVKESNLETQATRLIVEALVVRKMSLEEAFLDFGGFSLM